MSRTQSELFKLPSEKAHTTLDDTRAGCRWIKGLGRDPGDRLAAGKYSVVYGREYTIGLLV
jgi:hypothetical protein